MKSLNNSYNNKRSNRWMRWMRLIHRDLGFLMVGICLVYGISGILLNHMNGKDPAFTTVEETLQLPQSLSTTELKSLWEEKGLPELKRTASIDETHTRLMLQGGIGVYNAATGTVDYEIHKKNTFVYWINRLHYNKVKGWSPMADLFAVSLVFFAISGLMMVRGKQGIGGRGKWYLIAGLLIPVIYILLM